MSEGKWLRAEILAAYIYILIHNFKNVTDVELVAPDYSNIVACDW